MRRDNIINNLLLLILLIKKICQESEEDDEPEEVDTPARRKAPKDKTLDKVYEVVNLIDHVPFCFFTSFLFR